MENIEEPLLKRFKEFKEGLTGFILKVKHMVSLL